MPTITRYPAGGKVSAQAPPAQFLSNRMPVDVTGVNVARQLGSGLDKAMVELEKLQREQDVEAAMSATVQLENIQRELLHTPGTGAMNLNGKNAVGVTKRVTETMDKAYKAQLKGLSTNEAKTLVRSEYLASRSRTSNALMQHESVQQEKALVGTLESRMVSALEDVASDPTNPATIAAAMQHGVDAARMHSQISGDTAEVANEKLETFISSVHETAVARMVDLNPRWARAYYKEHKGEINGNKQKALEAALEEGGMAQRTQELTDDLWNRFRGNPAAAIAHARANLEGKEEDETVRRLKERANEARTLRSHGDQDVKRAALAWLEENRDKTPDDMPASMRGRLVRSGGMTAVRRAYSEMGTVSINNARLRNLEVLRVKDPEGFMNEDFSGELHSLGDRGLKLFQEQQAWRLKGIPWRDKADLAETKDWLAGNERLLVERGIEISTGSKQLTKTEAKKFNALDAYMLQRLQRYQQSNEGRLPDTNTQRQMLDDAFTELYTGEPGISVFGLQITGGSKEPAYTMTPEERAKARAVRALGEVPPADAQRIGKFVDRWNAKRVQAGQSPVNKQDKILEIYNNELTGRSKKVN